MHSHFQNKKAPLAININQLNSQNKKELQTRIKHLVQRRQEHEARIEKLISPHRISRDVTKESLKQNESDFSRILDQLDNNDPAMVNNEHGSMGAFGSHVNLLATVSLKTDYHLCEKVEIKEKGELLHSLQEIFQGFDLSKQFENTVVPKCTGQAFRQSVEYLIQEDLADDLIVAHSEGNESCQYFGTVFGFGKYEELHLSKEAVKEEQKNLILETREVDKTRINISWLLMKRLLSSTQSQYFPEILHRLFSYPIKSFNIKNSTDLLDFNELLGMFYRNQQSEVSSIPQLTVFGIDERGGYSCQISNMVKQKNIKSYKPILDRFGRVFTVCRQQLPVKHIPLSCLRNHFVVVTMTVPLKGDFFLSVGSAQTQHKYRVYIMKLNGSLVQSEKVRDGEFMLCKLNAQEYLLYIGPEAQPVEKDKQLQESFQLVQDSHKYFNLWVQGRNLYLGGEEVTLEIRLKQEYNRFTSKIANQYLKNVEVDNQIQQVEGLVIVKRQILSSLYLVVDTFLSTDNQPLRVNYQGNHMMTDHQFQQNTVTVTPKQSFTLYRPAEISSIQLLSNPSLRVDFKITEFYL